MAFGFGSPDSGLAEAEPSHPPLAINILSYDEMCKTGGITMIIFITILVFYLVTRYHILVARGEPLKNVTSPLYDHDKPGQSTFRRFMLTIEKIFVLPFVPSDLSSYVMWMFMWFFAITIPMAVTRYYESRWAHDLIALQGPLNLISSLVFGCGRLDLTAIPYSEVVEEAPPRFPPPPKSDKWGRIDWFFTFHLTFGIIWVTVGFIQIYKARPRGWSFTPAANWKAHRIFGRVAIFFVCAHVCMMAVMTYENPVNQHKIILFGYAGMIFRAILNVWKGIKNARLVVMSKKSNDQEKTETYTALHRMYMFFVYARTTVGSGTIRFAAWALWFVGQFLPFETRRIIDRGACQTYAEQGIGDATDCWRPVSINLMFTDLIVIWFELLFLAMPDDRKLTTEAEKHKKRMKRLNRAAFEQAVIVIFPSILLILADPFIENWLEKSSLKSVFLLQLLKNLADLSAYIWYFVVHWSDDLRELLYEYEHEDHVDLQNVSFTDRAFITAKRMYLLHDEEDDEHVKEE